MRYIYQLFHFCKQKFHYVQRSKDRNAKDVMHDKHSMFECYSKHYMNFLVPYNNIFNMKHYYEILHVITT